MSSTTDKFPTLIGVRPVAEQEMFRSIPVIARLVFKGSTNSRKKNLHETSQAVDFIFASAPFVAGKIQHNDVVSAEVLPVDISNSRKNTWATTVVRRTEDTVEVAVLNVGLFSGLEIAWLSEAINSFIQNYPKYRIFDVCDDMPILTWGNESYDDKIIISVCFHFCINIEDIFGDKRTSSISHARHVAMYLLNNEGSLGSSRKVGEYFGRDRSSAKYAIEKINDIKKRDDVLKHTLRRIMETVESKEALSA